MFERSTRSVEFVPDAEARTFLAEELMWVRRHLGASDAAPLARAGLITVPTAPRDLDELFALICGIQAEVSQGAIEFALVELEPQSGVPDGYTPLGNPQGQLLHTFHRAGEYVMVLAPALFRLPELVLSSMAREIGRLGLHAAGVDHADTPPELVEARAELAAVALGMGVLIANGAYVFENGCCGGGCGIDLRSIRAELSMPEACFALSLDASLRGLKRRAVAKHLEPTQKAAFKDNFKFVSRQAPPALIAAGHAGALK